MKDIPEVYYDRLKVHLQKTIPLSDTLFEQVKPFFTLRYLKKKEYLIKQAQVSRYESYIAEGLFQAAIIDDAGKEHALYFPHEDWWAGDFKSFKTGEASCMEIQALEDTVLLQISKARLEELYHTFPVFERFFRILNENAGIALQDRLVQHFTRNAEAQYKAFLEKYTGLHNRLPQKKIASFLGLTPEYFSQMSRKK